MNGFTLADWIVATAMATLILVVGYAVVAAVILIGTPPMP